MKVILFTWLFVIFGVIGGMECGTISLTRGAITIIIAISSLIIANRVNNQR